MSLIQMSFSGTIMILAAIVVRALAINRLPKKVFVLLWEIILLRLLIPFSIPSALSAYSLVKRSAPIQDTLTQTPVGNMIPQAAEGTLNLNTGAAQALQNNVSGLSVWQVLWIVGVVLCAAFFIVSYLRCYFEFRTSLPVRNEFVTKWLEEHPLKRTVQIRQSDQISAPLTYGIIRPVILVPKKTDWENRQQLQYVLTHEYIHIRHFDMVWKLIAVAALCAHWFNPAVWAMYFFFNRDIELSCDESVMGQFDDNSKTSYAKALITMEEKRSGLTPFYNNFSKSAIEKRIAAIMKTRKRTVWAVIIGAVILVAVVVLFATSAQNKAASNSDDGMVEEGTETVRTEEEQTATVGIVAQGINVPDVVLGTAKQYVTERFPGGENVAVSNINPNDYSNWRIESLAHVYTYDDLLGMTLQVYQMNYQLLAIDPESVFLVGGMTIDDEGWVMTEYANSIYFIFQQNGEELSHLVTLFENDCFPGDETFTIDLKRKLGLMEFEEERVSIEDYLIPEETSNGSRKELILELTQAMTSFYEAYFRRDKVAIMSHLVDNYPWGIEMYEDVEHADEVEIKTIRGLNEIDGSSDQHTLSLAFVNPGEDSLTYLVVIFENENSEWKVNYYGLEK